MLNLPNPTLEGVPDPVDKVIKLPAKGKVLQGESSGPQYILEMINTLPLRERLMMSNILAETRMLVDQVVSGEITVFELLCETQLRVGSIPEQLVSRAHHEKSMNITAEQYRAIDNILRNP